jgi:hypothetical protein
MQTVRISPIAAHFLLRSKLEQSLIVGGLLLFAAPWLAVGLIGFYMSHGDMMGIAMMLPAVVFGWLGHKLGTWAANLAALLRERRRRIERGELA